MGCHGLDADVGVLKGRESGKRLNCGKEMVDQSLNSGRGQKSKKNVFTQKISSCHIASCCWKGGQTSPSNWWHPIIPTFSSSSFWFLEVTRIQLDVLKALNLLPASDGRDVSSFVVVEHPSTVHKNIFDTPRGPPHSFTTAKTLTPSIKMPHICCTVHSRWAMRDQMGTERSLRDFIYISVQSSMIAAGI